MLSGKHPGVVDTMAFYVLAFSAALLLICFTLDLNFSRETELMGQFALSAKLARLNNKLRGTGPELPSMPTHRQKPSKASQAKILSTLAKLNSRLAAQMQAKLTENQANMPGDDLMTPHFVEALQDAAADEAEQAAPPRPNYIPPQLRPTYNHLPYIAPPTAPSPFVSQQPYAAPVVQPAPLQQPYHVSTQSVYQRAPPMYTSTYSPSPLSAATGPTQQLSSYDQQILARGPPPAQQYTAAPTYYPPPQPAYQPRPPYATAYQAPPQYNAATPYSPYAAPAAPVYTDTFSTAPSPADALPCLMCVHGTKRSGPGRTNANWRAPDLALKGKGIHGPLHLKAGQKLQIVNQMKALQRQILGDYRKNTRDADQALLLGPDGGAGV